MIITKCFFITALLCTIIMWIRNNLVDKNFTHAIEITDKRVRKIINSGRINYWRQPWEEYEKYSYDKLMLQVWK